MMENKIDEILADILNNNALTDDQKRLFKWLFSISRLIDMCCIATI